MKFFKSERPSMIPTEQPDTDALDSINDRLKTVDSNMIRLGSEIESLVWLAGVFLGFMFINLTLLIALILK